MPPCVAFERPLLRNREWPSRERERGERRGLETKLSDVIHCVRASKGPPYPLTSAASTSESPSHGGATKLVRVSLLTEGYFQKMSIFLARAPVRPRAQAPVARAVSLRHRDLAPDSTAANPTPLPLPLPPPSVRPSVRPSPLCIMQYLWPPRGRRRTFPLPTSNSQLTPVLIWDWDGNKGRAAAAAASFRMGALSSPERSPFPPALACN